LLTSNLETHGRLGNQLFTALLLQCLGQDLAQTVVLKRWVYSDKILLPRVVFDAGLNEDNASSVTIQYLLGGMALSNDRLYGLSARDLFNSVLMMPLNLASIWGNQQQSEYVQCLKKNSLEDDKELIHVCAIHVRRGDYLWYWISFLTQPFLYYQLAIQKILEETDCRRFVIFSDDVRWCRRQFKREAILRGAKEPLREVVFEVTFSDEPCPVEAIRRMSRCDYHIMSNGMFSWWAVFLSKSKKTIIPSAWRFRGFGNPDGICSHLILPCMETLDSRYHRQLRLRTYTNISHEVVSSLPGRAVRKLKRVLAAKAAGA
jgi:Glycosyl transferase family 11